MSPPPAPMATQRHTDIKGSQGFQCDGWRMDGDGKGLGVLTETWQTHSSLCVGWVWMGDAEK